MVNHKTILLSGPPTKSLSLRPLRDGVYRMTDDKRFLASGSIALHSATYRRLRFCWAVWEIVCGPRQRAYADPLRCCMDVVDMTQYHVVPKSLCNATHLTCAKQALSMIARLFSAAVHRSSRKNGGAYEILDSAATVLPELKMIQDAFSNPLAHEMDLLAGSYAYGCHKTISRALDTPWRLFSCHFPH